eukprot:TRINITY_DN22104_c0_g2_i1.p1 TRINITY_DN22104_c0_g2~~TRINITY_DN22104_c0_g2_i1.p1  ORF type:complete len:605 (+),score=107.28 TRINITY_DN22104_c0_g2_i1:81-1817(+)
MVAERSTSDGDGPERPISRELSEVLSADISKAVSLEDCLEKFGKHWVGDITGGLGTAKSANDSLPKSVTEIDDFLSHDWATAGWKKFITLCLVYNAMPATAVAIVFSGTFGILQIFVAPLRRMAGAQLQVAGEVYTMDSAGYFGLACGMASFFFVFLFGQRLRRLCRPSRMVFMDKLCIHQTNPDLKAKGILGLAGFLRISTHLVVLWSPRYFTRLWCVYEIASWLSQKKPMENVEISPVAQGMFISCVICGMTVLMIVMTWIARLPGTSYMIVMAICVFAVILAPIHFIRRLVADLRKMPQQVSTFKFENAECFCCAVGHKLKVGDETITIPCDREVISTKLQKWFGHKVKPGQSVEDLFSYYVRKEFGENVCQRVGGSKVAYVWALIATLPGWLFITDRFHLLWEIDGIAAWRLFFHYLAMTFAVFPSLVRFALYVAEFLDARIGTPQNIVLDFLVTALGVGLTCLPTLAVLYGLVTTLGMAAIWPQVLVLSGATLLTMLIYYKDIIAWLRMARRFFSSGETAEEREYRQGARQSIAMASIRLPPDLTAEVEAEASSTPEPASDKVEVGETVVVAV